MVLHLPFWPLVYGCDVCLALSLSSDVPGAAKQISGTIPYDHTLCVPSTLSAPMAIVSWKGS